MSHIIPCQEITAEYLCPKNALPNQIYCEQHLKEPEEMCCKMIPDITKNIVSQYLEYDELKILETQISGFKIDHQRFVISKNKSKEGIIRSRETYVDEDLRRRENFYPNGKRSSIENFKNWKECGVNHGKFYGWYANGNLHFDETWKNGILEGKQYYWHQDGVISAEMCYKNGELDGKKIYYEEDGNIISEVNYHNGVRIE